MSKIVMYLAAMLAVAFGVSFAGASRPAEPSSASSPSLEIIVIPVFMADVCKCVAQTTQTDDTVLNWSCPDGGAAEIDVNEDTLHSGPCSLGQESGCATQPGSKCTAEISATMIIPVGCPTGSAKGPGIGTSTAPCRTMNPGQTQANCTWQLSAECKEGGQGDTDEGAPFSYWDTPCSGGQSPASGRRLHFVPILTCAACTRFTGG